jgi:hypothetical protein
MRRRRKSRFIFRPRVKPPDVYLISPKACAAAIGVSVPTLARWRAVWKKHGSGPGPEPVYLTPRLVKYRVDDCRCFPGTFVERMKVATAAVCGNPPVAATREAA